MHLWSFAAWAWISAGLLCPLTSFAEEIRDPYPGETIAHYLGLDIVNTTDEAEFFTNDPPNGDDPNRTESSSEKNDTAGINGRDLGPVPWKPSPIMGRPSSYKPAQVALSATYNDTEDRGYNITIPGCTLADSILGDWVAPSGVMIENCTLAQLSQKLNLPSATLLNFTSSRAAALLAKINSTLQNAVCEPPPAPPDRELKASPRPGFRFDPAKQTGYVSSLLLVLAGSFGLGFTGLHLGIVREGVTANISPTTEVLILATFASFGTTCVVIIERERKHIGRAEAIILNAFIFLAEQIYDRLASGLHCVPEVPLKDQIQAIIEKLNQGARVLVREDVQAAAMRAAGSSSINLVSQGGDIENQLTNGHCGR